MNDKNLLLLDAVINLILGALLLFFPSSVVEFLGVPQAMSSFYPSILGAVLIGIGVALVIERFIPRVGGLGLGGAIAINLCGGLVLAVWLSTGDLGIPLRGYLLLWTLALMLVVLSLVESLAARRKTGQ